MAQDKTFFSAKSLATRWDVARSTVYRFVERGQLAPPLKINCNSRWRTEDVLAFEEAMREEVVDQSSIAERGCSTSDPSGLISGSLFRSSNLSSVGRR